MTRDCHRVVIGHQSIGRRVTAGTAVVWTPRALRLYGTAGTARRGADGVALGVRSWVRRALLGEACALG